MSRDPVPQEPSGRPTRVLLVEDNPHDAVLIERALLTQGLPAEFHLVETRDGLKQAIREFKPDVILSDYSFPSFNGAEVLKVVHELAPDLPFIFVSGHIGEDTASEVLRSGATDVVVKDRLSRLVPVVKRALREVEERKERCRAEHALRHSERQLRLLIEHTPAGVAMLDRDFKYLVVSPRWVKDFRLPKTDLVGSSHFDVFPELSEAERQILRRCMAGAEERCDEYKFVRADGKVDWVRWEVRPWHDEGGAIGGIILFTEVLTRRKSAEDELRESEERFRLMLESVHEFALIMLDPDGLVVLWNAGAERFFGFPASRMIGRDLSCTFPREKDGAHAWKEALELARKEGRSVEERERVRHDGSRFWARSVITPIHDAAGAVRGFARVTQDLTRERREREVRDRSATLEEANRRSQEVVRLKSELVRTLSHELRNPLSAILGFGERLYDGRIGPLAVRQKEALSHVLSAARHLKELTEVGLDVAKLEFSGERIRPVRIDLAAIVAEVRDCFEGLAAERKTVLRSEVSPRLGPVTADPIKIRQVLYNFVSNAVKFSRPGGLVMMSAKPHGKHAYRLEVQDAGPGIKKRDLGRLFQDFVRLSQEGPGASPGTGLGLAVTKRIVESHGGTVGVESKVGRGSRFFAVLPIRARSPQS